jgi:hypothetical protein
MVKPLQVAATIRQLNSCQIADAVDDTKVGVRLVVVIDDAERLTTLECPASSDRLFALQDQLSLQCSRSNLVDCLLEFLVQAAVRAAYPAKVGQRNAWVFDRHDPWKGLVTASGRRQDCIPRNRLPCLELGDAGKRTQLDGILFLRPLFPPPVPVVLLIAVVVLPLTAPSPFGFGGFGPGLTRGPHPGFP